MASDDGRLMRLAMKYAARERMDEGAIQKGKDAVIQLLNELDPHDLNEAAQMVMNAAQHRVRHSGRRPQSTRRTKQTAPGPKPMPTGLLQRAEQDVHESMLDSWYLHRAGKYLRHATWEDLGLEIGAYKTQAEGLVARARFLEKLQAKVGNGTVNDVMTNNKAEFLYRMEMNRKHDPQKIAGLGQTGVGDQNSFANPA